MTSELLAQFPVVIEIPVAWGDMDSFQHVNNAVYFRYIESARVEYFKRLDLWTHMQKTSVGPILGSISCRFRKPLVYPDTVSVGTRVSKVESDRFTMETLIVSQNHTHVAAQSEGVVVIFDYAGQKKAQIPDAVLARIKELES